MGLVDLFESGLDAPICLTWELTYACNLACTHCLSSSGRRDPRRLSTAEAKAVIDELEAMQIFYVNIGGGEPTVRADFWELLDYATAHHVGVKFSTNGVRITPESAHRLAANDYVDVQISLDGATADVNDAVRGPGSYDTAIKDHGTPLRRRHAQLQALRGLHAPQHPPTGRVQGPRRPLRRPTPSDPPAPVGPRSRRLGRTPPDGRTQRKLYDWLLAHGEKVLTGDSFFHLSAYGEALPGLNLCGAGRVVCLIDPVGDVYACPFAIHDEFLAGNVRAPGGFTEVWRGSELFARLRTPQHGGACASCTFYDTCKGGCMAAKFFTGLPLDGPDPECVQGYGETATSQARQGRSGPPQAVRRPLPPTPRGPGPHPAPGPGTAPGQRVRRGPLGRPAPHLGPQEKRTRHGQEPLVRDGRRSAAPGEEAAAEHGLRRARRGLGTRPYDRRQHGRLRRTGLRAKGGWPPRGADLSTTVLGVPLSFPVLISPTGVQAVDPEGEVAVARAAASRGVVMGLSSFASKAVEEVADAQPDLFYQLYWSGTRATMVQRMDRARAAGAKALIVTLDWSFSHGRDWGSRHPGQARPGRPC
ncbi:alpha-hydroxy-acid oxidizing protein [Streptomyces sp. L7]